MGVGKESHTHLELPIEEMSYFTTTSYHNNVNTFGKSVGSE